MRGTNEDSPTGRKVSDDMTRKRFLKLMRAAMIECYAINERNGGSPTTAKRLEDSFRKFKLPDGKSYAEVWEVVNNNLRGLVSVCR